MRELELDEILLEGKLDDDEVKEKKNDEDAQAEALKSSKPGETDEVEDDAKSDDGNNYLEKYNYLHRANIVATGTISIVVTLKNTDNILDIPNPLSEQYGAII
jgi:hypothetical protein